MNASLLTVCISQFDPQSGSLRDWCLNTIVYDTSETEARTWFEAAIIRAYTNELAGPPTVEKMVSAPVLSDLLAEAGATPIQWPQLVEDAFAALQATESIYQELGFWVDCEQVVPVAKLPTDVETLRNRLPSDINTALNWQADKFAYFLISALKPVPPPPPEYDELGEPVDDTELDNSDLSHPADHLNSFPELAEKDKVAVVKARNAVVAAWLWRRHAQGTPLEKNAIRVDPWRGAERFGEEPPVIAH
ncbi:MAG: hypothetical protein WCO56_00140 [Verrucomicrobiota bacterium]